MIVPPVPKGFVGTLLRIALEVRGSRNGGRLSERAEHREDDPSAIRYREVAGLLEVESSLPLVRGEQRPQAARNVLGVAAHPAQGGRDGAALPF